MQTNTFWLNFGGLSLTVTLKIRSRSPKPIQLFIMSECYIHANLVKIRMIKSSWFMRYCAHKHLLTSIFWLKFGSLSPALTLKNRSRSPKSNQLFIMSQCYIRANLKFDSLSPAVTLKNWSRSPKPNQLFIMSKCYIHANIVKSTHRFMRYRANKKVSRRRRLWRWR